MSPLRSTSHSLLSNSESSLSASSAMFRREEVRAALGCEPTVFSPLSIHEPELHNAPGREVTTIASGSISFVPRSSSVPLVPCASRPIAVQQQHKLDILPPSSLTKSEFSGYENEQADVYSYCVHTVYTVVPRTVVPCTVLSTVVVPTLPT